MWVFYSVNYGVFVRLIVDVVSASGFGDSPLFELTKIFSVSCFSCNVGAAS